MCRFLKADDWGGGLQARAAAGVLKRVVSWNAPYARVAQKREQGFYLLLPLQVLP